MGDFPTATDSARDVLKCSLRTPPLLLGAVLLFWGWHAQMLYVAAGLAAALEASRVLPLRWSFSDTDFRRIWTLSTLLFLGATIYAFISNDGTRGITSLFESQGFASRSESLTKTTHSVLALLQWLPLIFAPMILAQAYSDRERIDLRAISWLMRRRRYDVLPAPTVNLSYPYLGTCLLATTTVRVETLSFYVGLAVLLAWALWGERNRRFQPFIWVSCFVMVAALGYGGHVGLNQLQKVVQNIDASWLTKFSGDDREGRGSRTSLGSLGRLKLSGRIVMRVEAERGPPPELLREAAFNLFKSPLWYSARKEFDVMSSERDESTWRILPDKQSQRAVKISRNLQKGRGLLAVPHGVSQLEQLPVFTLKSNAMGVLKVEAGPGLVNFRAVYDEGLSMDIGPEPDDQDIPPNEEPMLGRVVSDLRLPGKAPDEILKIVEAHFRENFHYATYLDTVEGRLRRGESPVGNFLERRRSGHCEYFATATVLLLRKAGLPARYAVGYSVQERKGENYVVRARHAHAWCLVYVNGRWIDFDTTPASWSGAETQNASLWEPLADLWSNTWFAFSKWRYGQSGFRKYALWLVVPPLVVVFIRLLVDRRSRRRIRRSPRTIEALPGADSEFYLIAERLARAGFDRSPGEPLWQWARRVESSGLVGCDALMPILQLHYRYRFDPAGLGTPDRDALRTAAHNWLARV